MKRQIAPLLTVIMLCSLVTIPSVGSFFVFPQSTFMLADDWNQIGNATLELDTPEWNQIGNATMNLDMPKPPAPYSLHGFSETSNDDFWITPDKEQFRPEYGKALGEDPSMAETNTWEEVLDDDGTYWQVAGDGGVGMEFYVHLPELQIGHVLEISADWKCQDTTTWYINAPLMAHTTGSGTQVYQSSGSEGYAFRTVSVTVTSAIIAYQNSTGYLGFAIYQDADGAYVHCDDFVIEVGVSGYWESFYDVSDWGNSSDTNDGTETWTSNTDVGAFSYVGDSANDGDYFYSNSPCIGAIDGYYVQITYKMSSLNADVWYMYIRDADYAGSGAANVGGSLRFTLTESTSWITSKWYVPSGTMEVSTPDEIESVLIRGQNDNGITTVLYVDTLRIALSDEMGWQHDGSTTEGITELGGAGVTYTSATTNGDKVTFGVERTSGSGNVWAGIKIPFDTTATACDIDSYYYPFYEISWSIDACDADAVYYQVYADSLTASGTNHATTRALTTDRINILGGSAQSLAEVRIVVRTDTVGEGATITFDSIQAYSIANWTVTCSSTGTADVLFVTEETLYSNITAGNIVLDLDPALNVTSNYRSYEISPETGIPELSYYDGAWSTYTTTNPNGFPYGKLITDLRLRFTSDLQITNITFLYTSEWFAIAQASLFIDTPEWIDVAEAIIRLFVPVPETFMQLVFVIIGAILIPTSTVFLAYGGRKNLSMDKILLFLIIFFIGWALLLGAIM